jgi:hypothetical protein
MHRARDPLLESKLADDLNTRKKDTRQTTALESEIQRLHRFMKPADGIQNRILLFTKLLSAKRTEADYSELHAVLGWEPPGAMIVNPMRWGELTWIFITLLLVPPSLQERSLLLSKRIGCIVHASKASKAHRPPPEVCPRLESCFRGSNLDKVEKMTAIVTNLSGKGDSSQTLINSAHKLLQCVETLAMLHESKSNERKTSAILASDEYKSLSQKTKQAIKDQKWHLALSQLIKPALTAADLDTTGIVDSVDVELKQWPVVGWKEAVLGATQTRTSSETPDTVVPETHRKAAESLRHRSVVASEVETMGANCELDAIVVRVPRFWPWPERQTTKALNPGMATRRRKTKDTGQASSQPKASKPSKPKAGPLRWEPDVPSKFNASKMNKEQWTLGKPHPLLCLPTYAFVA